MPEVNEHAGVWGTTSVTWECNYCDRTLHSPADFDWDGDGGIICKPCQSG